MIRKLLILSGVLWLNSAITLLAQSPAPAPTFPEPHDTEPPASGLPLPAEEAAKKWNVPKGFQVTVFASEPDVRNPIAMAWDARGRLWVAENYTYADRATTYDLSLRDRVIIFEDRDGDGKHDQRTVFSDDLQMLTSVEIGRGGVWLMTPPRLIFIPDRDGDDKPDGAPEVILDGFTPSRDNYHTFANGLKWGPDGWLYGRCGASSPGRIGVPGTPDDERIPLHGGIWRYHPLRKTFEVLCHGTTNPWGHDWYDHLHGFFINTVNGHFWQIIPGAHYMRPHSEDPNPYVYEMIDTHADHYHWDTGKHWTDSRNPTGKHDELGGGHAHSGLLFYRGGNWPEQFRGKALTLNLHGRRINVERIEPHGSGYIARHEPDILKSADPWFRGLDLTSGPDGSVYFTDWSDTGECHDTTGIHRSSGRIYRVSYGNVSQLPPFDLNTLSNAELLQNLGDFAPLYDPTDQWKGRSRTWFRRQIRNVLAGRQGQFTNEERDQLRSRFEEIGDWEFLWSLGLYDSTHQPIWRGAREGAEEYVNTLVDHLPLDTIHGHRPHNSNEEVKSIASRLMALAKVSPSQSCSLALASAMQRVPHEYRIEIAHYIQTQQEDQPDHNLPLMIWYGLMPVAESDPESLARFTIKCRMPIVRRLIARRLTELLGRDHRGLDCILTETYQKVYLGEGIEDGESLVRDILQGMDEALTGQYRQTPPSSWIHFSKRAAISESRTQTDLVQRLNLIFGDGRALSELTAMVRNEKAPLAQRKSALATLISQKPDDLRAVCESVLNVRSLNTVAVGGLTQFDDVALGEKLARNYRTFYPAERPALIEALTARPSFAQALLKNIRDGKIPRTDLSAAQARQIRSFGDEALTRELTEVWGELRDSPADKQAAIDSWKAKLTPDSLAQADKSLGRTVFQKTCANCHRLYGHGGTIGPDLTGSGRTNLDYLLLNMVDPNATVGVEYRTSVIVMKDGRILTGIVVSKNDRILTLQTAQERMTVSQSDIEEVKAQATSLMPDGQLQTLTEQQVRDLAAYLMHPVQVPLP